MIDGERFSKAIADEQTRKLLKEQVVEVKAIEDKEKPSKKELAKAASLIKQIKAVYTVASTKQKDTKEKVSKAKKEGKTVIVEEVPETEKVEAKIENAVTKLTPEQLRQQLANIDKQRKDVQKQLDDAIGAKQSIPAPNERRGEY